MTTDELDPARIEVEINELMARTNLLRPEAAAAVLLRHGIEVSDLEPARPLTAVERDRLGLGRSALDEILQQREKHRREALSAQGIADD